MNLIESPQNSKLKLWVDLLESKGIRKQEKILLSGQKLIPEVLKDQKSKLQCLILDSRWKDRPQPLIEQTLNDWPLDSSHVFFLKSELFQKLDVLNTKAPLVVLSRPSFQNWEPQEQPEGLELFLALSDPANLGALLRSALAFDVGKVILLEECASPFLPKALKTSAGATLKLPIEKGPSLRDLVFDKNFWGLDLRGQSISDLSWPKNLRLLLGEEGQGLPSSFPEPQKIHIPFSPQVDSLSAPIAGSLALQSYFQFWSQK